MKKWRIELVTGKIRDVDESIARWAIGKKIARFIGVVWEIDINDLPVPTF